MTQKSRYFLFVLLFFIGFARQSHGQDGYIRLNAAIHCDTEISGGKYSPDELALFFKEQKLDAAFITDHDHVTVEYGFFPFRNVFKYRHDRPSVHTFGAENYITKIKELNRQNSDVFIFPGIEAVPFYNWEGSLFQKNLRLKNWHRHVLVLGLDNADIIEKLPSPINKQYGGYSFAKLFAGSLALASMAFLISIYLNIHRRLKNENQVRPNLELVKNRTETMAVTSSGRLMKQTRDVLPYSYKISKYPARKKSGFRARKISVKVGFIFCMLVLVNNYPFKAQKYSQYEIDAGAQPYQDLIDYVNKNNGLVFWAHPEAENQADVWKIEMNTAAYPELLLQTFNYTGFAIFWEGMKKVGRPGGIWDMVLNQYCAGKRKKPVWAIGELDFEDENDPKLLRETLTSLWLREKSEAEILDALKKGRMFATRNFAGDFISLEKFFIQDKRGSAHAISGEELFCEAAPEVNIDFIINKTGEYRLELIRNGKVIKNFQRTGGGEWKIQFSDSELPWDQKSYYRFLLYRNNWAVLASNPIFVKKERI